MIFDEALAGLAASVPRVPLLVGVVVGSIILGLDAAATADWFLFFGESSLNSRAMSSLNLSRHDEEAGTGVVVGVRARDLRTRLRFGTSASKGLVVVSLDSVLASVSQGLMLASNRDDLLGVTFSITTSGFIGSMISNLVVLGL